MLRPSLWSAPLAAAALVWGLAACAPVTSTSGPPALRPPARTETATPAPVPDSILAEEARDLAALEAEIFRGPVGSSNEDLDDELEDFLEDESNALLAERVNYDIPIVINQRVRYFIDYFQNRVNKSFARWLARAPQYVPYLRDRFRAAGLPEDLIYISLIESGFSPQATSHANAVGYWQFIASTGRAYNLRIDRWVDERRDFYKSTEAAIAYLKDLHRMFGSWYLAAAAYNSGQGRIQRAIEHVGSEDLWELSEFSNLREETKDYVPKLIAAILIAKEPEKYGFAGVHALPDIEVDTVEVPTQTELAIVAAAAGTDVATIRTLNPWLRSYTTPPGVQNFEVRVPEGAGDDFAERLARIPPERRVVTRYHVVRRGENLSRIASRYGVSVRELASENGIRNPRRIRAGQRLRIPGPPPEWEEERLAEALAREPAGARNGDDSEDAGDTDEGDASAPAAEPDATAPAAAEPYRPEAGAAEPLAIPAAPVVVAPSAPARGAPDASADVSRAEPETATDSAVRQTVRATPARPGKLRSLRYRVKAGDTLSRIAREHGVTVEDMERWNPTAAGRISPGTTLTILTHMPPPSAAALAGGADRRQARSELEALSPAQTGERTERPARTGAAGGRIVHRVRYGDTLWSIARKNGVTPADVRRWNGLSDNRIRAGQRLVLFPDAPAARRN